MYKAVNPPINNKSKMNLATEGLMNPANKLEIAQSSTQMNPKMDQREFHFAEDAKT